MKKPLLMKFLVMGGIAALLMIPMTMINSLILERGYYRDSVIQEIAQSSSRSQTLAGPIYVVPYVKTEIRWKQATDDEDAKSYTVKTAGQLFFLPKDLKVDASLNSETRKRGIYEANLYHADLKLSGQFDIPTNYGVVENSDSFEFKQPFIMLGISDVRGIESTISFSLKGVSHQALPGTLSKGFDSGFHVPLDTQNGDASHLGVSEFEVAFKLQGTSRLSILQLGDQSNIRMTSDWPHPSFQGEYLPSTHNIGAEGFSAHWHSSYFSNNVQQGLAECAEYGQCDNLRGSAARVDFIDPIDQYAKSDRATKYAVLFIALTFSGFFLFEILKRLKIHPVQYTLVGVSMACFYVLLVSLSEHLAFSTAYLISATACVLLIGFYVVSVLKSIARSLVFTACLGLLYGLLYGLLGSEDYALLMGSILLFAVLSLFMIATRKLDWYEVSKQYLPANKVESEG